MEFILSCDLLSNLYLCIYAYNFVIRNITIHMLWFAFKFVSLHIRLQLRQIRFHISISCDLLSNLYLCIYAYNVATKTTQMKQVVICFQICIFAYTLTTLKEYRYQQQKLWFAFKFVSLHIRLQLLHQSRLCVGRCDLLSNLYLCIYAYNILLNCCASNDVVICFQICIFAYTLTTSRRRLT